MKNVLYLICTITVLLSCSEQLQESQASSEHASSEDDSHSEPGLNAYFGDLHVHTSWSFDAFIYNTRTNPDDAYRYAKGEAINDFMGEQIKLKRPLDFMAVTDHSEYMGVMKFMIDPDHDFFDLDIAQEVRSPDGATSVEAFRKIGFTIARNQPIESLNPESI